jgi:hypothetical protein
MQAVESDLITDKNTLYGTEGTVKRHTQEQTHIHMIRHGLYTHIYMGFCIVDM